MTDINDIAAKVARSHLTKLRDIDAMSICEIADVDLDDDQLDAVCDRISFLAGRMEQMLTEETTA